MQLDAFTFRTLASGMGFTEGPVFRQAGEIIVTSIDRGHLYAIGPDGSRLFAVTGGGPNGATEGSDGSIYVTQNGGRGPNWTRPAMTGGVQAVRPDGLIEWITTDPISPNDLCFGPDGLLYVTDPTRRAARDDGRIWRIDVATKQAELLVSVGWYPNGIGFSTEDDAIYVVSSIEMSIVRFPFSASGLGKPEVAIKMDHGRPDGFAFDVEGNILIGANGDGQRPGDMQIWNREGKLLEVMQPGNQRYYTNVALSTDRRLILTSSDEGALLEVSDWPYPGLILHPFRHPRA